MGTPRTVPFLLATVFAGVPCLCLAQEAGFEPTVGWQNQRTVALQTPGKTMTALGLLARNHDMGRRNKGVDIRLTRDVTIRDGRATLFEARSEDFPLAKFSGAVDGKGIHFVMSWPP
ncbi:MAG TPA: hypothetical protein VL026_15525 [Rhizomicrobium sp.]|nr:hypothetical protein [Rhizomicrobium sp.]